MQNDLVKIAMEDEKNYRAYNGVNYSLLADYSNSPDHALMERENRGFYEEGKIFETVFQDEVTGQNFFSETYFCANLRGTVPDKIVQWLDEPECIKDPEAFLLDKVTYLKDGVTRSAKQKNVHAWIDACLEFKGKRPVSQDTMAMVKFMVNNMMKVELKGIPLQDLLESAHFQVPIFWEKDGIKKKALIDIVVDVVIGGVDHKMIIDLKSAADLPAFKRSFRSRYWLQDLHYTEGALDVFGAIYPNMIFLAASKAEPFIAQPFEMKEAARASASEHYQSLCLDVAEWQRAGSPRVGWKLLEELNFYY